MTYYRALFSSLHHSPRRFWRGAIFVVQLFSDLHKDRRNPTDAFRACEAAYPAALDEYHRHGCTLIVLGEDGLTHQPVEHPAALHTLRRGCS